MLIVYICQHIQSESTGDKNADRSSKKQLEELEEANEQQRENELAKSYLIIFKTTKKMIFFSLCIIKS
jgi:hypothetical protein